MTQPQNRYINKTRTAIRILVGFAAASVLKAIFCEQGIFGAQPAETGFSIFSGANAGVKRAASAAPLERLVMPAFDF